MKPTILALTDFSIIEPKVKMPQLETLDFIAKAHEDANPRALSKNPEHRAYTKDEVRKLLSRYGVKPEKISQRFFESLDLGANPTDIEDRARFFSERAEERFHQFYPVESKAPDHIIHVTCTGYVSPSAPQSLVNQNSWTHQTAVTHAYHMGCYAALPSVRMAEGFSTVMQLKEKDSARVDIVHTEMCGLHLNPLDNRPEQLVVQSLFADGNIKYSCVPTTSAKSGFRILNISEQIVPNSEQDMSWVPASWGMQMTLSREVPSKIGSSLRPFLMRLAEQSKYDLSTLLKNATFAIHPGGPKIIDSVAEVLELTEDQIAASKKVLFSRGNMSSATLPHVWKELLDSGVPSGRPVVSLAFGPGLTVFGSLFEVI